MSICQFSVFTALSHFQSQEIVIEIKKCNKILDFIEADKTINKKLVLLVN